MTVKALYDMLFRAASECDMKKAAATGSDSIVIREGRSVPPAGFGKRGRPEEGVQ